MDNIKVDGHPDLGRDPKSGAIINNNTYSYEKYMESYRRRKSSDERIDKIEEEVQETRKEIQELKAMLKGYMNIIVQTHTIT